MPELPEVEAARRLVDRNCKGKRITSAQVETDEKVFDGISASELKAKLEGATIASTGMHSKYFWMSIERAGGLSTLILHFCMTVDDKQYGPRLLNPHSPDQVRCTLRD
jgi:formamidopyrimidine-DNA glycosylase